MRLIVTEKNNSAKKIAEILGKGEAKADATYKVPYYTWGEGDDAEMTVGLKGHVLNPAFPEGYSNWQETDPKSLIDAELVSEPTDNNVVKAVKKLAKSGQYDAIVALGTVIRGGTYHFELVASENGKGLAQVMMEYEIPVAFGVLTTENIEQAIERAGTKAGNKGAEAALSALEMINVLKQRGV